jgi:hypothetical protein
MRERMGTVFLDMAMSLDGFVAGLKALLEHNIRLNLVADRYPKGLEEH